MTSVKQLSLLLGFLFLSAFSFAQSTAKIVIKKNVNGQITEEVKEVEIGDGVDISEVLIQMGLLDEFGQMQPGQEFEINIQKKSLSEKNNGQDWTMYPPLSPEDRSRGEMKKTAYLGVILNDYSENTGKKNIEGSVITEVIEGSPAAQAELQAGDVLVSVDDIACNNTQTLIEAIQAKNPGDKVKIAFIRDGKKKSNAIVLGEREVESFENFNDEEFQEMIIPFDGMDFDYFFRPDSITIKCPDSKNSPCDSMKICQPFSWNSEGFEIEDTPFLGVTPGQGFTGKGVMIGEIVNGSSAEEMGLLEGDIILEINGIAVSNFDELKEDISAMKAGDPITVKVSREGKNKEFIGNLGSKATSRKDDFRIFHDFKGLDENGNYTYDFEFDMDLEDAEMHMENLMKILEEQQLKLEEKQLQLQEKLNEMRTDRESITISIELMDITPTEKESLNKTIQTPISGSNDLLFERISFFPNPNNGVLNLNFQPKDQGDVTIIIYDSNGAQVYYEFLSGTFGNYGNMIDLQEQPNGSYYLQIIQNGKSFSKKIVKGK